MSDFFTANIEADIQWLVSLGPRPYMSLANQKSALDIQQRLRTYGWTPQVLQLVGNIVACRGKGHIIFLAHHDTVDHSAGSFVFDRKGRVRLMIRHGTQADAIAPDLERLLAES